jgi:murein DD-endopeptidase MepM/ murein hydrolase activator NlpD
MWNRTVSHLVPKAMRVVALLFTLGCLLWSAVPAQAHSALPPGSSPGKYSRWAYPSQVPYGPLENGAGNTGIAPARGAFLTLPFMGPHYITSIFDHCYPDYVQRDQICRYDGTTASVKVGGPDPTFDAGYAQTPGRQDYLYYSGHDGYDYGLYYEPIIAAAPGRVMYADWLVPGCTTCLSGLTVEINHGNGLMTFYGHMSHIWVAKGQYVYRGQIIGISGMTGTATGPHLHFGVYRIGCNGCPVDPYGWGGSTPDPWGSKDAGDLWIGGSPRYADIAMPHVTVSAVLQVDNPKVIDVAWSSPGTGTHFTVFAVTQDGVRRSWSDTWGDGHATYVGKPGETVWFWSTVTTDLGWWDGAGSAVVQVPHVSHGAAY